ncbi:MAG TPA: cyclase family protein [Candidatus Onthocola gallistercoris]|uniref:Cyclase family protein n=1 Tax=Candidatus Onthocola gallistercoris TaxID=2840876 RepID=A0A9D1HH59_9FIRM|nr:cyclase family protein [Candidatus Onthocola gallistercoris]
MYKLLSHTLNTRDRAFPGAPTLKLFPFEEIGKDGLAYNTFRVEVFNHFGTHMDGPNHFNPTGKQLWQMPLETFISESPLLLDIPKGEGEMVKPEDLEPYSEKISRADMLFIRSGFEKMRTEDNACYANRGPCVSADAAKLIVEKWQNLKAIAMDWISLASPLHPEEGTKAHQQLLGFYGNDPVLIIEDVSLAGIKAEKLEKVFVLPIFVEGIDSAPVTILAELSE